MAKTGVNDSLQSTYNTQWSQALNFLDEVGARGMLSREIATARVGGLVISTGGLSILNMRALERSWGAAAENAKEQHQRKQEHRPLGNRKARRADKTATIASPEVVDDWSGLRLLGALDQPIIMALHKRLG